MLGNQVRRRPLANTGVGDPTTVGMILLSFAIVASRGLRARRSR